MLQAIPGGRRAGRFRRARRSWLDTLTRILLGLWLLAFVPRSPPPDPPAPIAKAAALREGALLTERHGEPCADRRAA